METVAQMGVEDARKYENSLKLGQNRWEMNATFIYITTRYKIYLM
jgi:hypothetical protein